MDNMDMDDVDVGCPRHPTTVTCRFIGWIPVGSRRQQNLSSCKSDRILFELFEKCRLILLGMSHVDGVCVDFRRRLSQ